MRKGRPEVTENGGLVEATRTAPASEMRIVGRLALLRGMTLGDLARGLNDRDGLHLQASNVRTHFASKRPRTDTIAAYAELVGSTEADVLFAAGKARLAPEQVNAELSTIRRSLRVFATDFEPAAIVAAMNLVDSRDEGMLEQIASRHRRASLGDDGHREPLAPLIAAFASILDLGAKRRYPTAAEGTLYTVWLGTHDFPRAERDAFVALAIGFLEGRGIPTASMQDHLDIQRAALEGLTGEKQS